MAALAVPTSPEIQSVNVNEMKYYHANHFFSVLRKQVDATIEDAFEKGLLLIT